MLNTKEKYNEYLDSVDNVCMECALMSEEQCEKCPVRITVKQLEEYFDKHKEETRGIWRKGGNKMIDHIVNEELGIGDISLITNIQKSDRRIFQKAIELSGHSELYIADDATDIFGNRLKHLLALRSNEPKELSDFWDVYEQIKEEQ